MLELRPRGFHKHTDPGVRGARKVNKGPSSSEADQDADQKTEPP